MATKRTRNKITESAPDETAVLAASVAGQQLPAHEVHDAAANAGEPLVIPVIEELLRVDKRVVESGKVRISKRITEREELVDVPLLREEVQVERVPLNLFVEAAPSVRQEGDTMIIPIVREEIVVQKRLLLVEELRVRKQIIEEHKPQQVTLLAEEVDIQRVNEPPVSENPAVKRSRRP